MRHEFKSWTRLIAFHIALIPLGKVWIQLFSLPVKLRLKIDLASYPARTEGLVNINTKVLYTSSATSVWIVFFMLQ